MTGQQQERSPDFLLLSPAWRQALQHVPAGLQGEREDRPQHADENPRIRSYSRAQQLLQMDLSLPVLEFFWSSASTALHPSALWEPMHQHGPWHACASCGYVPETGATPNAPCQLLKFYKLTIYFGQSPMNRNFHAARYTHRRIQVTESHKIMRAIFRIIKRDEGHDPGADKGECRNLSVET